MEEARRRNPGATLGIPLARFARSGIGTVAVVFLSLFLSLPRFLARARSRPAFRSHTDTDGLIRVRLTYCLIIGPPRERSRPDRCAAPRRVGHLSRAASLES